MRSAPQDDESKHLHKGGWRLLVTVALLTFLVRGGVLWVLAENMQADPDAYKRLAEDLARTGVFGLADQAGEGVPTAFRPPLYPFLLSMLVDEGALSLFATSIVHLLCGILTVLVTYRLGERLGLGGDSFWAALLVAVDPILLQQSTLIMTETLATLLAVSAWYMLTLTDRRELWAFAAGLMFGIAVLCRPTFLPWLGLVASILVYRSARQAKWATGVAFLVAVLISLAPWAGRNFLVFSKLKLTTTHGGYTLLLGNNPLFYDHLQSPRSTTWDSSQLAAAWDNRSQTTGPADALWDNLGELAALEAVDRAVRTNEIEDDRLAYALARRYISQDPASFAYSCVVRVVRLWRVIPHALSGTESNKMRLARYAVALWYSVVFLLATAGAVGLGRHLVQPPWLWFVLLAICFTAVHAFFWSNMRMRAPLMPGVYLLATSGLASLSQLRKRSN